MFEPGSAAGTIDTVSSSTEDARRVSAMSEGMSGSEILRIAGEIRAMTEAGQRVCNLTVGDFSPAEFRVPKFLETEIADALRRGETNYPPSNGVAALRESVRRFYASRLGLDYSVGSVLITAGSRPGYLRNVQDARRSGRSRRVRGAVVEQQPLLPPDERRRRYRPTSRADAFLPTRELLEPVIRGARLLSLNSPLNPTGTAFYGRDAGAICDLVLEENARRGPGERPLYVMYDQVYWMLTFGDTQPRRSGVAAPGDGAVHDLRGRDLEGVRGDGRPCGVGRRSRGHHRLDEQLPWPRGRVGAARGTGRDGEAAGRA